MDRHTVDVDVDDRRTGDHLRRRPEPGAGAVALGRGVPPRRLRLDLGSGPGHLLGAPGGPGGAAGAAGSLVDRVTATRLRVRADLGALPFRPGGLHGAYAPTCFQHVEAERLPLALADLQRSMAVGAPLHLVVVEGDGGHGSDRDEDRRIRRSRAWPRRRLVDVVVGAGFTDVALRAVAERDGVTELHVSAIRDRSLADTVDGAMRMLLCGLNPSLYSADRGVGYARPGNRFWPALRAAGLAEVDRDPWALLRDHRLGMTDVAKRATTAASEVDRAEFAAGLGRVERLCRWLRPGVLYLVGLQGWRAAVDRRARPGLQPGGLGGVPVYLGPSTSGLNASTQLPGHVAHLQAAAAVGRQRWRS